MEAKKTTITFETRSFAECISLTRSVDAVCFPREMWLGDNEINLLVAGGAETTILKINAKIIGQAITLPECCVAAVLSEGDPDFDVSEQGLYAYSEAIIPDCQNRGYGGLLLHEIALRAKQRQFTSISAHVRMRFGWHRKRRAILQPSSTRQLCDFWENPCELVEFQLAQI